jgi:hypothetical protein
VDSELTEPRAVTLTLAGIRGLTVLEIARACAISGVRSADAARLLRGLNDPAGDPGDLERATELLYACAMQLERRRDPALTWETAQTWRLTFDLDHTDPIADAEAEASVSAAIATGLPPSAAGALTMAQAEAYENRARELAAAGKG